MTTAKTLTAALLAAAIAFTGCGEPTKTPKVEGKKDSGKKEAGHAHGKGPNGGVTFDLGKHHAEFTVDHDKKECTIIVLGADEKTATPVVCKELTLTTKETKTKDGKVVAPMTIKMLPKDEKDGKSTKFVGTDPGLGNIADFDGTVLGEIEGKPSQGEFKE